MTQKKREKLKFNKYFYSGIFDSKQKNNITWIPYISSVYKYFLKQLCVWDQQKVDKVDKVTIKRSFTSYLQSGRYFTMKMFE